MRAVPPAFLTTAVSCVVAALSVRQYSASMQWMRWHCRCLHRPPHAPKSTVDDKPTMKLISKRDFIDKHLSLEAMGEAFVSAALLP